MSTDLPASQEGEAPPAPPSHDTPVKTPAPKRAWPKWVALIAALAAIGGAVFSLKDQIRWPGADAQSGGDMAPRDPTTDALRNTLVVTRVDSGGKGVAPVVFVSLGRTQFPAEHVLVNDIDPRRLLNELVRQAVLMAASNRLGAVTRDAVIGEDAPEGTKVAQVDYAISLAVKQPDAAVIVKSMDDKAKKPVILKLPAGASASLPVASTYPQVLERAEVLAREELPKVLKDLGVSGAPVVVKADGKVPDEVRDRLNDLTFTEQFAAVRALHGLIRSDGESPERLAALIRGYANLGTLTEFHWSIAHDVFKARSLLAAQRWVARDGRSAEALRHRAYAYALAGLHRFALDDVAAAKKLPAGSSLSSAWAPLIETYCRFDTKGLLDAKGGPNSTLALFLALRTVEESGTGGRTIAIGRELLAEHPECYRVHDAVCAAGGVSVLHQATMVPLAIYTRAVPRRLQAIRELPPGIAARLHGSANEIAAAQALIHDGRSVDRGEPSWGALGRMMDEVRFVQVYRRASFLAHALGVPAGEFVDSARPMFVRHPYRDVIESLGVDRVRDNPRYESLVRGVTLVDVEGTEIAFFLDMLCQVDMNKGQSLFREAALHQDTTEHDLKTFLPRVDSGSRSKNCGYLEDVSPYSPVARAGRIDAEWPKVESKARDWEKDDAPPVLLALGRRYVNLKRWDDAERCMSRCLELAPERYTYELAAQVYRAQGDWKRWQKTLDKYLASVEDYGLDHAQTQVEIANHLMDKGLFKEAEPYATAAAETWAAFGMECAIRCYQGLEDWSKAELWVRRESERYSNGHWFQWYLFCKRTGHGDVEAARDFTERYIASLGSPADLMLRIGCGCFYLMNGQKPEALAMFQGGVDDQSPAAALLMSALTADTIGDNQLRNRCIERLATDPKCVTPGRPIYEIYHAALKAGEPVKLDMAAVEKALAALPKANRGNALFHIGWFLTLHGSPEAAADYLKRCIDTDSTFEWYQYIAKEALSKPDLILRKVSSKNDRSASGDSSKRDGDEPR